jgi:beta-lactamase class A
MRPTPDRRFVISTLAAGLAACGRAGARRATRSGPFDAARVSKGFPAIAARAGPAVFAAGLMNPADTQSWFSRGEQALPMAGLTALPTAAAALAEVDAGRLKLGERITITAMDLSAPYSVIDQAWPTPPERHATEMPAIDLISLALQADDNTAADAVMKRLGGPGAVTAWLRQVGIKEMRVDRYAREVAQNISGMEPFRPQWKDETAWIAARDTVPAAAREMAMNAYLADPRDTTTVRAAVQMLYLLSLGELLSAASTRLLLTLMATSRTGANRLAAGLPAGAALAQKPASTRTDLGLTPAANDVGIVTFKDGRRIIMAGFLAGSTATQAQRDRLFADAARLFTRSLGEAD